ncbi:hypothetical protein AJ80_02340 [Polytolypa hystricis UAMH7299]|uniref:Uncharacterized protein n=1 Tax=Polytolypa hystricis (strain UAMH7299) TaxID=1447883 RepID=A0A2B7YQW1_POLH7|nr:hypothetical protein AJ80_02340 [Polytolypa hystricis UAMH7299]
MESGNADLSREDIDYLGPQPQGFDRLHTAQVEQLKLMLSHIADGSFDTRLIDHAGESLLRGWTQAPIYDPAPISIASRHGHLDSVKLLLKNGSAIDSNPSRGLTLLCFAAMSGCEETVKLLLENRAEVDSKSNDEKTPLAWAAQYNAEAVVKLLLEKGAEIESKSKDGQTPLAWAAYSDCEAAVKLLLQKGAEIDSKSDDGKTPLAWAATRADVGVVNLLLEQGKADPNSIDKHGRTPLYIMQQAIGEIPFLSGPYIEKDNGRIILFAVVKEGLATRVRCIL